MNTNEEVETKKSQKNDTIDQSFSRQMTIMIHYIHDGFTLINMWTKKLQHCKKLQEINRITPLTEHSACGFLFLAETCKESYS